MSDEDAVVVGQLKIDSNGGMVTVLATGYSVIVNAMPEVTRGG